MLLAIIPIVILNKLSQKYVPEANEEKGNFEILAEIIIQVLVIFLGILLIHRIITYIPTYSGTKYPDFSVIYIILAVLMITLSLQTKLGEKVSILTDRIGELWNGTGEDKEHHDKKKKKKGNVRVSQPISQGGSQASQMMTSNPAISQSLYSDSTPIHQLPQQQSSPDFNSMYRNDANPLVNAATPGMDQPFVPMAANEGGAFGSPFGTGF